MSVKEVTSLRKAGKLGQAYTLALNDLREDPDDSWAQTAMFWVLRDICQLKIQNGDLTYAEDCLKKMKILLRTMEDSDEIGEKVFERLYKRILPESDKIAHISELSKTNPVQAFENLQSIRKSRDGLHEIFHEDIGWIIYRFIKNQADSTTSHEIRKYLSDYIKLHNPRPSMLHSMVLNFAINFSKNHQDFIFYNFFKLWGPENLRYEDFKVSYSSGIEYPSLISRIARIIVNSRNEFSLCEICNDIDCNRREVLEVFREAYFWKITNLHKNGDISEMIQSFISYDTINNNCEPTHWDSEILRLAIMYLKEDKISAFFTFMRNRWNLEFYKEDWQEQKDKEGNIYPCIAIQAIKRCFEFCKTTYNKKESDLQWLSDFYDTVIANSSKDEWISRQRAIVHVWQNKTVLAIEEYKKLLLSTSDKYYIWSELAGCVEEPSMRIALLCKALTLEKNEEYLGNIHLFLAETLIKDNKYLEARIELNIYAGAHEKLNVKYEELSHKIEDTKSASKQNTNFYQHNISKAEEFAFSDCNTTIVTLVDIWEHDGKTRYEFTDGESVSFSINTHKFYNINKLSIGASCRIQYATENIIKNENLFGSDNKPEIKYIPLSMHKIDSPKWENLPIKYGYIEYFNKEKEILHILSQDSAPLFYKIEKNDHFFKKGDFLTFRQYSKIIQNEVRYFAKNLKPCDMEDVLEHVMVRIAAVDDINQNKKLYHFTFGAGKIGGIVYFDQTTFIPEIGECVKMWALISKDKAGNKKPVVLKTERTDEINTNAIKKVSGRLELHYPDWDEDNPDFAFLDDCYVHISILHKYKIKENCYVEGEAVYSGKGKWKVVKISKEV